MIDKNILDSIAECYQESGGYNESKRRECLTLGEEHGLEFIGAGANREVLGTDEWAFKFSYFDPEELPESSVHGNKREVEIFKESSSELQKNLATPHNSAPDYSWVKFRRYNGREGDPKEAYDMIEEGGWNCSDLGVLKTDNQEIIIDYEYCVSEESDINPNQLI